MTHPTRPICKMCRARAEGWLVEHLSHSLKSLKGVLQGIIQGNTIGVIKGDTRSLDNGSFGEIMRLWYRNHVREVGNSRFRRHASSQNDQY